VQLPPVLISALNAIIADIFFFNRVFPGHIHAFYLEFVYFDRRDRSRSGTVMARRAPLVFSQNIQTGGAPTYGTTGGY